MSKRAASNDDAPTPKRCRNNNTERNKDAPDREASAARSRGVRKAREHARVLARSAGKRAHVGAWWSVDGCIWMAGAIGCTSAGTRARIYIVKRGNDHETHESLQRIKINDGNQTAPLADKRAWAILEQFLTMDMTDGDDDLALRNLRAVKAKHIPSASASSDSSVANRLSSARIQSSRKPAKEEEEEDDHNHNSPSGLWKVTSLPGSSSAASIMDYIATHLRKKCFIVKVSAWIPGQLYVVADSPKTIADSLPSSLYLAVKQYVCISDEEHEEVKHSYCKLPSPAWVRIKHGKYKGDIAQVFDSNLLNDFIVVLVPPWDFPYSMPPRSQSLLDRSHLPNGNTVSNITHGRKNVGYKYKGEKYYMGLLLHSFHRDRLEHVVCPHADDIQLHLQSGWEQSFLKRTVVAFSMQFLHVGDCAKIIQGDLSSEIGKVISTDHPTGSATLELSLSGQRKEVEVRLQDIEHVFWIGDMVQVVAGPCLGVEGHIIQMVEVSKYYLDCCPLSHTLQARLPTQQLFKPPPNVDSIQIGDYIEVLFGEHIGKCGIVHCLPKGADSLWFQDGTLNFPVPISFIWRTHLPHLQTLQYTKDRGYDIKPGDVVRVVDVLIPFVAKVHNANFDSFKKEIGQEVFIIGGNRKGYRATLYSVTSETCTVAVHGQQHIKIELKDVATSVTPPPEKVPSSVAITGTSTSTSMWTAWTSSPDDQTSNPLPGVNPNSLTTESNPWTVNADDTLDSINA
ncbi:hypothetical protein BDR06DRAFT_1058054 [Suillus hirtellus]|nr:hypothetical protein BDR06DRAFT_1058054 [Suillus hirtellus]